MKTLNLKLTGSQNLTDTVVCIDDEEVKIKKNEFKNLTCNFQTEKDRVNLKIYKALDVGGVWWFLTQLFFFVISIFGIFDIHSKNRYLGLQYESEIDLTEDGNITLGCNRPKENAKAFEVETNLQTTEINNKFFVDEQAKRKLKILTISKVALFVIVVAVIIAVTFISL